MFPTMRLDASEVAYYIDLTIEDLETRLEYSPFKDEELDNVIESLYRIARAYESLYNQSEIYRRPDSSAA